MASPVLDIVGQLVELSEPPSSQGTPPSSAQRVRAVVEALRIAQEEVDEQEDQQEGGQDQVYQSHPPAQL